MDSILALQQLTNSKNPSSVLRIMTGSTHVHAGEEKAEFIFKGFRKANVCRIELDRSTDTYVMTFLKIRKGALIPVEKFEEIYCDSLKSTFEGYTGLTLTVPRFR